MLQKTPLKSHNQLKDIMVANGLAMTISKNKIIDVLKTRNSNIDFPPMQEDWSEIELEEEAPA